MFRFLAFTFAATLLSSSALAQSLGARDLQGQQVAVDSKGTLIVFWSMDDVDARADLAALQELADAGQHVLAVNVDGAQRRSELKPFMRRHGWSLPVVSDHNDKLVDQLSAKVGETVLLAPSATLTAAWRGDTPAELYDAPQSSVAYAWLIGAL